MQHEERKRRRRMGLIVALTGLRIHITRSSKGRRKYRVVVNSKINREYPVYWGVIVLFLRIPFFLGMLWSLWSIYQAWVDQKDLIYIIGLISIMFFCGKAMFVCNNLFKKRSKWDEDNFIPMERDEFLEWASWVHTSDEYMWIEEMIVSEVYKRTGGR